MVTVIDENSVVTIGFWPLFSCLMQDNDKGRMSCAGISVKIGITTKKNKSSASSRIFPAMYNCSFWNILCPL